VDGPSNGGQEADAAVFVRWACPGPGGRAANQEAHGQYARGVSRGRVEPRITTVKTLFAVSGNLCQFIDSGVRCEKHLTDPKWQTVRARICNIRGESPGSARYDETMTDEGRRHFAACGRPSRDCARLATYPGVGCPAWNEGAPRMVSMPSCPPAPPSTGRIKRA
jgi:hypothetical protein